MARGLPLADRLDLLFAYGESRGISAAYRAIAVATGENATNIRKVHRGENLNPGLQLLSALTRYFRVDLDYFNCTSRAACGAYLRTIAQRKLLDHIEQQAVGLSEAGRAYIKLTIDYIRRAEGLPPFSDKADWCYPANPQTGRPFGRPLYLEHRELTFSWRFRPIPALGLPDDGLALRPQVHQRHHAG